MYMCYDVDTGVELAVKQVGGGLACCTWCIVRDVLYVVCCTLCVVRAVSFVVLELVVLCWKGGVVLGSWKGG